MSGIRTVAACAMSAWAAGLLARHAVPGRPAITARIGPYLRATVLPHLDGGTEDAERQAWDRLRRLDHSGLFSGLPPEEQLAAYRTRVLTSVMVQAGAFGLVASALDGSTVLTVAAVAAGALAGAGRWRARVDRAIELRRERMQIELYTVNHLLAMQARVGGGVVQALTRLVARGHGPVVEELTRALRAHRSGRPIAEALEDLARETAEPHAARTYRLLSRGAGYGADLAAGLRALSDDLRAEQRQALQRAATRRRAGMLVPIIALLAPVMLLFVAAPLPSIVFGSAG